MTNTRMDPTQTRIVRMALVTVAAFAAFRLGSFLPLPGVDVTDLSLHGGGALSRVSQFALGLWPWLSALTAVEFLVLVLPAATSSWLGLSGRNRPFSLPVVALALIIAALQGYGVSVALTHVPKLVADPDAWFVMAATVSLVAGMAVTIGLARIVETQGVGHGFWVLLAGSILANVPSQAQQLFALVAQGHTSMSAGVATLAIDIAIAGAVVALLDARRRSGFESAEPIVWPVMLAPLVASWIVALVVAILPGGDTALWAAIDFFLLNHPAGMVLHWAIACALVARYASREGSSLGFLLPTVALAIAVALLSKLALTGLSVFPLVGGPPAVIVATVCYVFMMRWHDTKTAVLAADAPRRQT